MTTLFNLYYIILMKRKQFEQISTEFDSSDYPTDILYSFDCPICGAASTLSFGYISQNLINNVYHKNIINHDEFEVEWLKSSAAVKLKCTACDAVTIMLCKGRMERTYRETHDGRNVIDILTPIFFYPPLQIIHIPLTYSSELQSDFEESFSLFWSDAKSCANKIRVAIERFLDYLNIGNPNDMIHARLSTIESTRPDIYKPLMTIKFFGNEGSHRNDTFITKGDLLDAYEIIEPMLYEYSEEKKEKERKEQEALKRLSLKYDKSAK